MKNKIKAAFVAVTMLVIVASCKSNTETANSQQDSTAYDSTTVTPQDTTSTTTPVDSTKNQ
jgi:hypothetical protein